MVPRFHRTPSSVLPFFTLLHQQRAINMAEKGLSVEGGAGGAGAPGGFRATRSAAELAAADAEGYAEPGLAEHKSPGGRHLDPHWKKGYGGLRLEGEDVEEEEQRLHELEQHSQKGLVQRTYEAVGAAVSAVAGAVMPGLFKASKSAAELAAADAEGYAEPGLAEHKSPGGRHLEPHWKKGYGGLRPEGEDVEEEEQRLHELEQSKGVVQRSKEAVASTAAAASEKASEVAQAAKEMVGLEPKK